MTWWEATLLGLLQGLTEFIPVSSSGHLVLGKHLFGISSEDGNILFEVLVHFGTVLSVLYVYHRRIWALTTTMLRELIQPGRWRDAYAEQEDFHLGVQILITIVPTGIAYLLFSDALESAFNDPRLAAGMLFITGLLLVATLLVGNPEGRLSAGKSFITGIAQSLALIPGISRSGATICAAIYQNVDPERAADFSFLMLLPVVIGATIVKVSEASSVLTVTSWVPMLLGTVVAFVSGVYAIRIVLDFVRRGRLAYFAVYCFVAGGLGLLLA